LKYAIGYCFLLLSTLCFAQNTVAISGVVTDSLQKPLLNVTLIAKPQQETLKVTYAITTSDGSYTLQLQKDVAYMLSVSHLVHETITKEVLFTENTTNYNISLITKNENLDEVIINYKYQPIEKKKDTITYNLDAFTNGNEFKMEDVLAKLPGIKVEDDVVKVQGKPITKLLVDGKLFFGGDTKLAIKNIPADVMAKIEIISDYKESELLRNLADNEDLALNVVLKEDKKNFAFGDIQAGAGLDEFYTVHPALFKYNPTSNISFISDINNFNNSSLSFSDLSRLVGGSSNLFKRGSLSNSLQSFSSNNENRFKSTTRFSALNFQKDVNEKFAVTGYAVYSDNDVVNKAASVREYLAEQPLIESRNDLTDSNTGSAMFNIKLDYNPNLSQKWMYNVSYLNNISDFTSESLSTSDNTNEFLTAVAGKNTGFSQNLEGYFRLNDKHTLGVALEHSLSSSNSADRWSSNSIFLQDFLPLVQATDYQIRQANNLNAQRFNLLIKDYWIASRYFHLFYNVGLNYKESRIQNDISQFSNDTELASFLELGNDNPFALADWNAGLGIKTIAGKFEFIFEAIPHYYVFKRAGIESSNLFLEPKLDISFKIDDDSSLDFGYDFTNRYLNDISYLENLKVTGFNSVLMGNPSLTDTRSHNFSLYYSDYRNMDKYFIDASIDYSINNPAENNSVVQIGINQLNSPVILNLPEENLSFNTELGLIFNKNSLEFGVDMDLLKINQVINGEVGVINSLEYSLTSKYLLNLSKQSALSLQYKHTGFQVVSEDNAGSTENIFSLKYDLRFLKNFIFKTDVSTHFVNDFSNSNTDYTVQNAYLGYNKPNSKFSYSLNFRNIFNNGVIVRNNFNGNLISSNQIFTLPRVLLAELRFKF
jgi:hypothetical protein